MAGKLKITTFNCQGFKERMYDYVKEIFKASDILLLQETWLYDFEHSNFANIIPNCQFYAISGMDSANVHRQGRPYGGCAVLWKKNIALAINPINTTSPRICAVEIKSEQIKLILITVYMPNDNDLNNNIDLYGDVLSEISSVICNYEHDIIIAGDLNVDYTRTNSQNLNLLKQFLHVEELECATLKITHNNFTREDSQGSRSFIDHIIVSINYSNPNVLYKGNNLSDHNPVTIQTNHSAQHTRKDSFSYKIIDWDRATKENIKNYKKQLDYYLIQFNIPPCVINCNNLFCNDHDNIITEKVDEILDIMTLCAELTIPTKKITNEPKGIPGWNGFVKPYKNKSIFCHEIWVSAGKPTSAQLFND